MWNFIKQSPKTFSIAGLILLIALGSIIWAVSSKEGDNGFLEGLYLDKTMTPVLCFYDKSIKHKHLKAYNLAAERFNQIVPLFLKCQPWLLRTPPPEAPVNFLVFRIRKLSEEKIKVAASTILYWGDKQNITGAVVYVSRFAKDEDLYHIILHELGHVIGLDHDRIKTSFMYKDTTGQTLITKKDQKRIKEKYGKKESKK